MIPSSKSRQCRIYTVSSTRHLVSIVVWISSSLVGMRSAVVLSFGLVRSPLDGNRSTSSSIVSRSRLFSTWKGLDATNSKSNNSSSGGDVGTTSNSNASRPYERLMGSPKYFAAPMVSQSDYAFRTLCRRFGVDCAYTQMYHAKNFASSKAYQDRHMDIYPAYLKYVPPNNACPFVSLDTNSEELLPLEGGPLVAQIAGHNPATMLQVAQTIVERTCGRVQAIDVNLGCPQQIARKGRYGAFLLRDMDTVTSVLSTLRRGLPKETVGLTAKIRIPDYDDARGTALIRCLQQLMDSGVDWITVHGRTLYENKTAVRGCNWDKIALAVQTAHEYSHGQVPIIANGGIEHPSDFRKCLEYTGAAGIMSSEALLENPGLFSPTASDESCMSPRQILERQFHYATLYLDLATAYPPVPGSMGGDNASHSIVKAHLFKFLHRYFQECPDLRDALASAYKTPQLIHTRQIVTQLWERYDTLSDEQLAKAPSSQGENTWYRRHRTRSASRVHSPRVEKKVISSGGPNWNPTIVPLDRLAPEERKISIQRRIEQLRNERMIRHQNRSNISFSASTTTS
jgi:tRNA-dihydrouridine synthase